MGSHERDAQGWHGSRSRCGMAVVMAFVVLFALASSALFVRISGSASFGSVLAGAMFVGLAVGLFVGLLRRVRRWEPEEVEP